MSDRPTPSPFSAPARLLCLSALALQLAWGAAAHADVRPSDQAKAQLSFGVDMARRGLWREALFRFGEAEKLAPESSVILNNLAVAYEATGEFARALDYYQRALKASPNNRDLRNNYARFIEFYQSFQNAGKRKGGAVAGRSPAPAAAAEPPATAAPSPSLAPPTIGDPIARPRDEPANPAGPADIPPPSPTSPS